MRLHAKSLETYRASFASTCTAKIHGLLTPSSLGLVRREIDKATFEPVIGSFYCEMRIARAAVWHHLLFLVNAPEIFQAVEAITGCGHIGCFVGRIYRRSAGGGHHDDWHDDAIDNRLVGLSINLGRDPYDGGELRLRDRATQRELYNRANTGPGDAVLFKIDPDLQHIVMPVTGFAARTAFAGWFCRTPEFEETSIQPLATNSARHTQSAGPGGLPDRLRPAETIAFRPMHEDLLIHCAASDTFVRLDPVGRRIWELLMERGSVAAVVDHVIAQFDAPPTRVADDISSLLGSLVASGVLEAA